MVISIYKSNLETAARSLEVARDAILRANQDAIKNEDFELELIDYLNTTATGIESIRRRLRYYVDADSFQMAANLRTDSKAPDATETSYPKYLIRGGSVVRIGLTRSGSEYEHVVKQNAFKTIIDRINNFSDGREFSVDELQKQIELPVYQTYLVVSLLKEHLDVLVSAGRGKYRFREQRNLVPSALVGLI